MSSGEGILKSAWKAERVMGREICCGVLITDNMDILISFALGRGGASSNVGSLTENDL